MPIAVTPAGVCRAKRNGRWRHRFRASPESGATPGETPPTMAFARTSTGAAALRWAPSRPGTARAAAGKCSATSGSGPRAPSIPIRASCAIRTSNTPSPGSGPTRSYAAAASRLRRAWYRTPGRISTSPNAAISSPGSAPAPSSEIHPLERQPAGQGPDPACRFVAGAPQDRQHDPGRGASGAGVSGQRRYRGDDTCERERSRQAGNPQLLRKRTGEIAPGSRGRASRESVAARELGRNRCGHSHAPAEPDATEYFELPVAGKYPGSRKSGIDTSDGGCGRRATGFPVEELGVRMVPEGDPGRHGRAFLACDLRGYRSERNRAGVFRTHHRHGAESGSVPLRARPQGAGRLAFRQRGLGLVAAITRPGHRSRAHPHARTRGVAQCRRGGGDLPLRADSAAGPGAGCVKFSMNPVRRARLCLLAVLLLAAATAQAEVSVAAGQRPSVKAAELARRIHAHVNAERVKDRLSALTWDKGLSGIAAGHSRDMVKRKYLAHNSPEKQRSEEHTSELQSLTNLVCRLLLENKKEYLRTSGTVHSRISSSSFEEIRDSH